MAILHRFGSADEFDPSKMEARELAYVNTTNSIYKAGLYLCYAPGDVRRQTTEQDIIDILNSTPEVYTALQQLLTDLEDNPSELTSILSNISALQTDKLDKTGDSKDNIISFEESLIRENITTGESHATMLGKINKFFTDLKALAFKDKVASADLEATLKAYIDAKFNSVNIVQTTEVSDATKVPSSVVTNAQASQISSLSTSVTAINNNLGNKKSQTAIVFTDTSKYSSTTCYYTIKNGYCAVIVNVQAVVTPDGAVNYVFSGLPLPMFNITVMFSLVPIDGNNGNTKISVASNMAGYISVDGKLGFGGGVIGEYYRGVICYPVA